MSSIAPTEFLSFSKLPPELREMVWDEAIPTLDLQRFNAEIALHPDSPKSSKFKDLILCLTPHDDFVQLTSGYVGLLGACRESRRAAIAKIKGYLPINYVTSEDDGSVAVRFAKVPYNPDGNLCISGLGPAFIAAAEGYGARGMKLPIFYWFLPLCKTTQCATYPEVKNLTITIDMPGDLKNAHLFMWATDEGVLDNMVEKMTKLETLALVDERWMNEWHRIDAKDLEWLHNPAPVLRRRGDDKGSVHELDEPSTNQVPWVGLFLDFLTRSGRFNALKKVRAGSVDARAA